MGKGGFPQGHSMQKTTGTNILGASISCFHWGKDDERSTSSNATRCQPYQDRIRIKRTIKLPEGNGTLNHEKIPETPAMGTNMENHRQLKRVGTLAKWGTNRRGARGSPKSTNEKVFCEQKENDIVSEESRKDRSRKVKPPC